MKQSTGVLWLALALITGVVSACTAAPASISPATASSAVPATSAAESPANSMPGVTPAAASVETPLITTLGAFFALSVPDAKASADWYSEKLGLKVTLQPPKTGQSRVIVLEGGGLIVELIEQDNGLPLSEAAPSITNPSLIHGIAKVGVIVEDLDKTVALLKARGVAIAFGPFPATADQRANLIIQDNNGNLVQFFEK